MINGKNIVKKKKIKGKNIVKKKQLYRVCIMYLSPDTHRGEKTS